MSHASYAINTGAGASLTINDGKVLNLNAHAIRLVNFGDGNNQMTINGGYIEGTRAVQMQLPGSSSSSAPEMNLQICGGTLKSNESTYNLAIYVYSNGQSGQNVKVSVTGGTIDGNIALNEAVTTAMSDGAVSITGGAILGAWGVYSYADDEVANGKISIQGGEFSSLYPLKYMGKGHNTTFKLTKDLTDETITIPTGVEAILDLNGHAITQQKAQTDTYAMITNKGTLTIMDNSKEGTGLISYEDITEYSKDNNYASNTIRNEGTLTLESGTIQNVSSGNVMNYGYPHAIDVYQGSKTNIKGGTVKSANYDCIRMFCNSKTLPTIVNISGGNIINRVTFQNPNNNTHTAGYGMLNITGGKFTTTENVNANVRLLNFSKDFSNMKAVISGGTFDKGVKTQNHANTDVTLSDWLTIENGVQVTEIK